MSPQFGRVKLYAAGIDLTGRKRCNAICSVIRPSKDGVGKADISASMNGDRKTLDSRDTCSQRVCGEKRRRAYEKRACDNLHKWIIAVIECSPHVAKGVDRQQDAVRNDCEREIIWWACRATDRHPG